MSDKIQRRELLLLVITLGAAAVGAGAGTYAYLSDSDSSSVTVESGALTLASEPNGLLFEEVGEDPRTASIDLVNDGTIPARQVRVTGLSEPDLPLGQATEVLSITYNGTEIRGDVIREMEDANAGAPDHNGNGIFDVGDLHRWLNQSDDHYLPLEQLVGGDGIEGEEQKTLDVTVQIDYSQEGMVDSGPYEVDVNVEFWASQEPQDGSEIEQTTPVTDTPEPTTTQSPQTQTPNSTTTTAE